jgi:hypothetical protein
VLHGMALMTGADPGSAGTANPFTLFSASNEAARSLCTMKKKDTLSPLNTNAIAVWKAASAEAASGNLGGLAGHYGDLEKSLAARFMQYSLVEARAASQKLKTKEAEAADACRKPCVREAQQVGGEGLRQGFSWLLSRQATLPVQWCSPHAGDGFLLPLLPSLSHAPPLPHERRLPRTCTGAPLSLSLRATTQAWPRRCAH